MKKKKNKSGSPASRKPNHQAHAKGHASVKAGVNRRTVLKSAVGIGAAVVIGAGVHAYDVQNKAVHDLSIIGNGKPVVVQVHDPSCDLCRQLKRATETALEASPEIEYRIADLTTKKGEQLAKKYGAKKVTLLLFNDGGEHIDTIQGVTPVDRLKSVFAQQFSL